MKPGQNCDYWTLMGDVYLFRSLQDGRLILQYRMDEESQIIIPSSSVEDSKGLARKTVISVVNTFDFALELYEHIEDEMLAIQTFQVQPGGHQPTLIESHKTG